MSQHQQRDMSQQQPQVSRQQMPVSSGVQIPQQAFSMQDMSEDKTRKSKRISTSHQLQTQEQQMYQSELEGNDSPLQPQQTMNDVLQQLITMYNSASSESEQMQVIHVLQSDPFLMQAYLRAQTDQIQGQIQQINANPQQPQPQPQQQQQQQQQVQKQQQQ